MTAYVLHLQGAYIRAKAAGFDGFAKAIAAMIRRELGRR
jgi:hypothetical protein